MSNPPGQDRRITASEAARSTMKSFRRLGSRRKKGKGKEDGSSSPASSERRRTTMLGSRSGSSSNISSARGSSQKANKQPKKPSLREQYPHLDVQGFQDAISLREADMLQWYLEQSVDYLKIQDKRGMTAMHNVCQTGNIELIRLLWSKGASFVNTNATGAMPLHYWFGYGLPDPTPMEELLEEIIAKDGELPFDAANSSGNTCLHYAVQGGAAKMVPFLIRKGANVNATNLKGMTPLLISVWQGELDATEALLEAGADMWIQTKAGESVLRAAKESESQEMRDLVTSYFESESAASDKSKSDASLASTAQEEGKSAEGEGSGTEDHRSSINGEKLAGSANAAAGDDGYGSATSGSTTPVNRRATTAETNSNESKDDSKEGLVFKTNGEVRGGTITKLVELLTSEKRTDIHYMQDFLLTYRAFTTGKQLLQLLIERYNLKPPKHAGTLEEMDRVIVEFCNRQKVIRLRVFNVFKKWVENFYTDFAEDHELMKTLTDFLESTMKPTLPGVAKQMQVLLEKKQQQINDLRAALGIGKNSNDVFRMLRRGESTAHLSNFAKDNQNMRKIRSGSSNVSAGPIKPLEIDPKKLAQDISTFEGRLFAAIESWECLDLGWTKKPDEKNMPHSPHVTAMIQHSNQMGIWIKHEILQVSDVQQRGALIKRFIKVAEHLREMNNLNGVMEIVAALNSSPIFRLKQSWNYVPSRQMKIYNELNELVHPRKSSQNMRNALHNADPPCLPYLGMYLTDLVFICDGNPDLLEGGYINMDKHRMVARVISEMRLYQTIQYDFPPNPSLMQSIASAPKQTDDEFYALSLEVEPRARKPVSGDKTKSSSSTADATATATGSNGAIASSANAPTVTGPSSVEIAISELLAEWGHPVKPTQMEKPAATEELPSQTLEEKFPTFVPPTPPDSDAEEEDAEEGAIEMGKTEEGEAAQNQAQTLFQLRALVTQMLTVAPKRIRDHFDEEARLLGAELPELAENRNFQVSAAADRSRTGSSTSDNPGFEEGTEEVKPPAIPPKPTIPPKPKTMPEVHTSSNPVVPAKPKMPPTSALVTSSAGSETHHQGTPVRVSSSSTDVELSIRDEQAPNTVLSKTNSISNMQTTPGEGKQEGKNASTKTSPAHSNRASINIRRCASTRPLQQRFPVAPAPLPPPQ